MKFLQIKYQKQKINPKILEMGVDFNHIRQVEDYPAFLCNDSKKHNGFDKICNLSDCYQSRPLIEIDGFCEFDVVTDTYNVEVQTIYSLPETIKNRRDLINLGSIFKKENQEKYPELYQGALKIINK
jgi:hypothetical protein